MSGGTNEEIDWGRVFTLAMDIALETRSPRAAEETVSTGIEAVFAGDAPWDPQGKVSLERHVIAVGFNILRNKRRAVQRRQRADFVAELSAAEEARQAASPDEAFEEIERRTVLYTRLRSACEGAPDALQLLDAEAKQILGREAQMKHCGMTERAWTLARNHIGRKLQPILEDEKKKEEADE